jgi:hypothetical protein
MTRTSDYEDVNTYDEVYRLCGDAAEQRAKRYARKHGMSERDACQAAVAWWRNSVRQRRMRYAHSTGAHDHIPFENWRIN